MEFVQGSTVNAWLRERERDWSEVVAVYRAAGEGLVAAHAAGLVHRDFKPDNVMVADDGRVLVMDFGLARSSSSPRDVLAAASSSAELPAVSADLTAAGSLVGTPAYMSPEQFDQAEVGPQSDQFSFCSALFEGLWGTRPFEADSLAGLAIAVRSGRVRSVPARTRVPKWLTTVVLRGLSVEPSARHPSMRELLATLDRGRRRGRGRLWIGGVALVALAGTGVAVAATSERRKCRAGTAKIAEVWNAERRDRIGAAYEALALPYAADTWARAVPLFDGFAEKWAQGYYDACAATRIHGEQSGVRLDARMDCLEVERAHLESLLGEFESPDERLVERTIAAANGLPEPEDCADADELHDPELDPAKREVALAARSAYAEGDARLMAGRYGAAIESLEHGLSLLRGADLPGVEGELLQKLASARRGGGDFAGAEQAIRDGLHAAGRAGRHRLVAGLWLDLLFHVAIEGDGTRQGPAIADAGEIAVLAAGDDPELRWAYEDKKAMLLRKLGDLDEAEVHHRRAIELAEQIGAEPRTMAVLHSNFGSTLYAMGRYREAREMQESSLADDIEVFGETHPIVALDLNEVARCCAELGDHECALANYERSLAMRAATLGEDHPQYADSLFNLSIFRYERLMLDDAQAGVERAKAIWLEHYGADSDRMGIAYGMLGNIARTRQQPQASADYHAQAEKLFRKLFGDDHPKVAIALSNRANALKDLGRYDDALALHQEALRIREAKHGVDHPDLAYTLTGTAELLLAMGRPADAIAPAERAIALREPIDPHAGLTATAYFTAAKARWDADEDRARAIELAQKAWVAYASSDTGDPDETRAEIVAWLEERGASPPLVRD
jgi:serine/threonine-protein kinase